MTSDTPTPTESLIDRDLLSRDLDRLAGLLVPLFLTFLGTLRTFKPRLGVGWLSREVPVGALVYDRLKDYPAPMIYGALASLLEVPDGELRDLCAVIAGELGAWCREADPLTPEQVELALPAFRRLTGGGTMPAVDWTELEAGLRRAMFMEVPGDGTGQTTSP